MDPPPPRKKNYELETGMTNPSQKTDPQVLFIFLLVSERLMISLFALP